MTNAPDGSILDVLLPHEVPLESRVKASRQGDHGLKCEGRDEDLIAEGYISRHMVPARVTKMIADVAGYRAYTWRLKSGILRYTLWYTSERFS